MRRFLCLVLAALMLISLASCGEEKTNNSEDDGKSTQSESAPKIEKETEKKPNGNHEVLSFDFINEFDHTPSMEEQPVPVYDKNDLTVTATGIRYDTANGPMIDLRVVNNSSQGVTIQCDHMVVNGYMFRPEIDNTVAARKKADLQILLPYLNLAMENIRTLRDIRFALRIMDAKKITVLDTTGEVQLELADTAEILPDPQEEQGDVVYDKDHVKIVLRGIKRDTQFKNRYVVLVYMRNDADKAIAVQNDKLEVNGYGMTTEMTTALLPGTRAVDKIELFDTELDEHNIIGIDIVKASFEINDYETWKTIGNSDLVMIEPATEVVPEEAAEIPPAAIGETEAK